MKLRSNKRRVKTGFLLLFFMSAQVCLAQFPYALSAKKDFAVIGFGAISLTAGQMIDHQMIGLSDCQVLLLDPNNVNAFDRKSVGNYSEASNTLSEGLLLGTGLASLTLLLDKGIRKEWATVGVMGVEVLMLTYGVASITKGLALRPRPYTYNENVSLEQKQSKDARYSFYSQTTAATAGISFFAAKVYSDTHPNSKWKPVIWTGAAILPLVTGWAKVDAGEHFTTDVMVGYSMGALLGYFIPVMHLNKKVMETEFSIEPSLEGVAVRMVF
jgi:membrane-associated phospholipid phosphatase